MEVFYGKNNNKVDVALKIEIKNKKISDSSNEGIVLSELEGIKKFLIFIFWRFKEKKIAVESLFGLYFKSFFITNDSIYEPKSIFIISIQITNILVYMIDWTPNFIRLLYTTIIYNIKITPIIQINHRILYK